MNVSNDMPLLLMFAGIVVIALLLGGIAAILMRRWGLVAGLGLVLGLLVVVGGYWRLEHRSPPTMPRTEPSSADRAWVAEPSSGTVPLPPNPPEPPDPPVVPGDIAPTLDATVQQGTRGHYRMPDPGYLADVYPSERTAAAALGRHIADQSGLLEPPDGQNRLTLSVHNELNKQGSFAVFRDALRQHLPEHVDLDTSAVNDPAPAEVSDDEPPHATVRVQYVNLPEHEADWGFAAVLRRGDQQRRLTTGYIDKPWVIDLEGSGYSEESHVVVQSPSLHASAAEAVAEAREWAVGPLLGPVSDAIAQQGPRIPGDLQQRIRDNMDPAIVDTFVQRFTRPYGDVYRATLLVDRGPVAAGEIAQGPIHEVRQLRHSVLSIGGLAVVLLALYGFLQVATRGYYTWALRGFTIVALIGSIVAMVLLGYI